MFICDVCKVEIGSSSDSFSIADILTTEVLLVLSFLFHFHSEVLSPVVVMLC